jgi:16S rRNA (adenine1518-N6/adenine1519-N6)-dimethyltransferase
LRNSLKSFNFSDNLKEDSIFDLRPEQLTVDQFISITQKITADGV